MIGDAYPHEWKDYHESILDDYSEVANSAIDWRDEVEKLIQMVVSRCPVMRLLTIFITLFIPSFVELHYADLK